jgi:hypothetical protein
MRVASALVLIATPVLAAAADTVPNFDVGPSCRGAARQLGVETGRVEACLTSERDARTQLNRDWSTFPAPDRGRCAGMVIVGGPPSYVELLTCLEMARDAAKLPGDNSTTLGSRP